MRSVVAVCLLAACNDAEPTTMTSRCGSHTHLTLLSDLGYGNHFMPLSQLPPVAAGGTTTPRLHCETPASWCDHSCYLALFDRPFEVDYRDGPVLFADYGLDGLPAFYAADEGTGSLAIVNPEDDFVHTAFSVRAIDVARVTMTFKPQERAPDGVEVVLSSQQPGPHFAVGLWGAGGEQLADSSLAMQLPLGARHVQSNGTFQFDYDDDGDQDLYFADTDEIDVFGVPSGTYVLGFHAGRKTFTEQLEIVNEADALELVSAPASIPRDDGYGGTWSDYVCFAGWNGGRFITGLSWQYTIVSGTLETVFGRVTTSSCVRMAAGRSSFVTITASAGGQTMSVDIPRE